RLYSGSHCAAGEIGAIPYREHTIEHYCAGAFFQRNAGMPGEAVYARAQAGEPAALALFEEFGFELGYAVLLVLYAYDPELIVLGGSISVALPLFGARMRERLRQYPWPHVVDGLRIAAAEVQDAGILGAAALYLDALDGGADAAR
ncbi:MAG TPA: ROK family protein, partial [Thermoanaerobaculia bacterium]|nr:ROK family protein [Thermoanaerobaculia bacterium]